VSERKTLVVAIEGAADRPQEELGGRTPLEAAQTPTLDRIAREGRLGRLVPVPEGLRPEEGAFALSLFGLDPRAHPDAAGALEAAGFDVEVGSLDQVFRLALVTAHEDTVFDPTAGHVRPPEAALLVEALEEGVGDPDLSFVVGEGWRNLLVWKGARDVRVKTTPPFDVVGKSVRAALPRGTGTARLLAAVARSAEILSPHEVNECRRDLHENPATLAWPWSPGVRTTLPDFRERLGLRAAFVGSDATWRGAARLQNVAVASPPPGDAPGDLEAETAAALTALGSHDLVFLHLGRAAAASHSRDFVAKVQALERIDAEVVAPCVREAESQRDLRLLVVGGEAVASDSGRHLADPVPFAIFGPGVRSHRGAAFTEVAARDGGFPVERPWDLLDFALHLP
jgi:2,3-bisphosphoglycerate-independent phosphoglycerate mutase